MFENTAKKSALRMARRHLADAQKKIGAARAQEQRSSAQGPVILCLSALVDAVQELQRAVDELANSSDAAYSEGTRALDEEARSL